jgi:hypothetical protein
MAALRQRAALRGWLGLLLFSVASTHAQQAQPASPSLYAQAASVMLDRSFPSPRVEYLLLDPRTEQTIAVRWSHPERPIPVGSLLKPFVALAYGDLHSGPSQVFPAVYCHGKSDGCWRTGGHGSLGLERALAVSCNAYFLALAKDISSSDTPAGIAAMDRVSASYGLPAPPAAPSPQMLIGVTPEWRISPPALARAYARLTTESGNAVGNRLMTGMRLAASPGGTAAKAGRHPGGVLAKTGTAPCVPDAESNSPRCLANGDGLAVLAAPAENPRMLLLVRQRGTTGAQTAEVAGQMLARLEGLEGLEESHAPPR